MNEVIRYGARRGADVRHGYEAFQFVMPGLVKEVAESNYACSLTREVHGKHGSTAGEDSSYRVQFLAAAAQVVASYDEVSSVEGGSSGKEKGILTIPESMVGTFRQRRWLDRSDRRSGRKRDGLHRRGLKQRSRNFLAKRWPAQAQNAQQNCRLGLQNVAPAFPHNFCEYRHWPPVLVLTQGLGQAEWPLGATKLFRMITLELAGVTGVTPPSCKSLHRKPDSAITLRGMPTPPGTTNRMIRFFLYPNHS